MAKFLATRIVTYNESCVIEADTLDEAQEILDEKKENLNWDDAQYLDADTYDIREEITDEDEEDDPEQKHWDDHATWLERHAASDDDGQDDDY